MLLRGSWLPLGIALVVVGVLARSGPLVGLGVFVLLAGGLARAWADRALDRVSLERLLPESRAFPGEHVRLTYRLTNHKLIPLPRIEMRDQIPEALTPPDLELPPSSATRTNAYTRAAHLGWNERITWSLELPCETRGYYRLGPARLRSGDGFGLFITERADQGTASVVVYPRTLSMPDLGLPSARPLGERKGRERIFEDPVRVAGVRAYQPGDALRRIDWKATARSGQLQSRVYEPSTTQHLLVALNVDTMEHSWEGYVPERLEANIVVAASIARWAFESGYAVGLLANGSLRESLLPMSVAPGRAPAQLLHILESLGGIEPMTMVSLAELLERAGERLPQGATLAVVTAQMPEALATALRRRHDAGQQVVVLQAVDEDWSELLGEIAVRRLTLDAATEPRGSLS
ncbi:MAG: DUF58 domain-containing protein [Dehalococcoidia bacterium]